MRDFLPQALLGAMKRLSSGVRLTCTPRFLRCPNWRHSEGSMTSKRFLAHCAAAALVTALAVSLGRAQAGRAFTTNFTLKEFASRRAKIIDAIGPQAVDVMQGLPTVHSSAIFRQSNEFFYVSGVVAPQALLLIDGAAKRSILYLPKQNSGRAATEGDLLSSDDPIATAMITGFDEVKSPDQLEADLKVR